MSLDLLFNPACRRRVPGTLTPREIYWGYTHGKAHPRSLVSQVAERAERFARKSTCARGNS